MHTFSYQNGNAVWSLSSMSSAAFGTYIVPGSDAFNLSALAVMVNSPQLAVSALYFTYNSLLTSMSAAAEFSSFSSKPRGLRVSLPSGYQRSTYWLQLPYKYGLPLLAIMAVLHWIISQAFFMLQVNVYNMENTPFAGKPRGTFTSTVNICGYSRDGVLIYFIIHGALVAGLITLCCRKFKANVPILAGCSLAISAACHLGTEEDVATTPFMPLMYGVIQTNGFVQNRVAFSGKQVGTMENEVVYQ